VNSYSFFMVAGDGVPREVLDRDKSAGIFLDSFGNPIRTMVLYLDRAGRKWAYFTGDQNGKIQCVHQFDPFYGPLPTVPRGMMFNLDETPNYNTRDFSPQNSDPLSEIGHVTGLISFLLKAHHQFERERNNLEERERRNSDEPGEDIPF